MALKLMNLRRDDHCVACLAPTPASTSAWWDSVGRNVTCTRCRPADFEATLTQQRAQLHPLPQPLPPPQPVEIGVAGASAALAYERRAERHLQRAESTGTIGTAVLPQHVVSWQQGAEGEQRLGRFLDDALAGTSTVVLHDRLVVNGSKRGNIDHLVIASSGVWVIDAKNHAGTVDIQTQGVWKFKQSELYVGRRRQNKLVDAMGWQAAAVQSLLEPMGMGLVPIHPALCFVQSDWSRRSNAAVIDGVLVLSPDKLCSVVAQPGLLRSDAIHAIATQLSSRLPAAVPR